MKTVRTVGLTIVLLIPFRLAGAQVINIDVGVPVSGYPTGTDVEIVEAGLEGETSPVQQTSPWPFTATEPGDLILYNQAAGDAPSSWYADIRFFNPLDPTGTLGMPATETEAFFPADLGPGGFSTFQLFPDYNLVPGDALGSEVLGFESIFGPVAGIPPGYNVGFEFVAATGSSAPAGTPEPGSLALATGLAVTSVFATRRLRRRN